MDSQDIDHRFNYHPPPSAARAEQHADIRELCKELAHNLNLVLPEGREKSLAITHLEETMMWSNAALARQGRGSS